MTPSVRLRNVADSDVPHFFKHQLDPEALHRVAFTKEDPADRAAFDAHWAKIRADASITIRTILLEGEIAGHVAQFERDGDAEVTYWIDRGFWGRGVATKALLLLLDEIEARPLYGRVAHDHVASKRVLEKCGFVVCGHERCFAAARGEEIDEVILKLE